DEAFGPEVGGEVSGMLDDFGNTIDRIVSGVAKIGLNARNPLLAARQLGENFFEDVLDQMAKSDTSGKTQLALDARDIFNGEPPDADQIGRLQREAKKLLQRLTSNQLPTQALTGGSASASVEGFIAFRVFYPRPDGVDEATWLTVGQLVVDQVEAQAGISLASIAPVLKLQFTPSGLIGDYVRLPVPDVAAAIRNIQSIYGNPPWQITGPMQVP
ncbi:MAG: hypothetical protein WA771_11285, partial [Chthoniobacterales bacterium]